MLRGKWSGFSANWTRRRIGANKSSNEHVDITTRYSPNVVEDVFPEVRIHGVLGSPQQLATSIRAQRYVVWVMRRVPKHASLPRTAEVHPTVRRSNTHV